jgi:hypothetical protein
MLLLTTTEVIMKYMKDKTSIFWQEKPLDYIRLNEVINTYRLRLSRDKRHCPRCQSLLFQDLNDLVCSLRCDWRESNYFSREYGIEDVALIQRLIYNKVIIHPFIHPCYDGIITKFFC